MSETTQTSQSLYQALWNSADVLRSKMDANDYKSYLLGMVFTSICRTRCSFSWQRPWRKRQRAWKRHWRSIVNTTRTRETHEELLEVITDEMSYAIHPDLTFTALVERVNDGSFQLGGLGSGLP